MPAGLSDEPNPGNDEGVSVGDDLLSLEARVRVKSLEYVGDVRGWLYGAVSTGQQVRLRQSRTLGRQPAPDDQRPSGIAPEQPSEIDTGSRSQETTCRVTLPLRT